MESHNLALDYFVIYNNLVSKQALKKGHWFTNQVHLKSSIQLNFLLFLQTLKMEKVKALK